MYINRLANWYIISPANWYIISPAKRHVGPHISNNIISNPKNKKIMKTKIYIVTFTSYTESDNYLHTEQKSFTNPLFAQDYYEQLCNNAHENANEIYVDANEGDGEDWSNTVEGEHHNEDKNNRRYTIEREPGTEFGYQVEVKLETVELDVYAPQIFLFDRNVFTEQEADAMTWEDAHELAQVEKGLRHVWQYDASCGTFAGDFNRGCMDSHQYYIRIYNGE